MKAVHCLVLGLAIAAEGWICAAQVAGTVQSPSDETAKVNLMLTDNHATGSAVPDFHSTSGTGVATLPLTPRVADSKFFLLNGAHLGMAVFDVELTQRCIADHRCRETNPLMPSSQAGQLSVNFATVACSAGVSYWLKKHHSKLWWLLPVTGIGIHSIGVATGFEHQ